MTHLLYDGFSFGFQVRYLLNDIDPKFIKKFVLRADSLFLNSFPVTPNCHRVTEITHAFSNGQRLIFVRIPSFTAFIVSICMVDYTSSCKISGFLLIC